MEIVERSSGYWVTGEVTEGPFDSIRQAQKWADEYKIMDEAEHDDVQDKLREIFMRAYDDDRWSNSDEFKSYLKGMKGKLLVSGSAAKALVSGKKGCVVFLVPDYFCDEMTPSAVVTLPEDVALKIVSLGVIP